MNKYIFKHFKRSVVSNILFCLLLTMAGALLCISSGLWFSAHDALQNLDDTITTIAMPDYFHITRYAASKMQNPRDMRDTIRETVYKSDLLQMDQRRIFGAYADGIRPVPLRASGYGLDPLILQHSSHSLAAFVVTFEKEDTMHAIHSSYSEDLGEYDPYIFTYHAGAFTVEEALFLHQDYQQPRYIHISYHNNPDGSAPFELGKKYVVIGTYTPSGGFGGGFSHLSIEAPNVPLVPLVVDVVTTHEEYRKYFNNLHWSYTPPEYNFPEFPEKPIEVRDYVYERDFVPEIDGDYGFFEFDGNVEELMASEKMAWMNDALKTADVTARSFQVLTTNEALSLFRLNQRGSLFDEGRTFTAREQKNGARVCLVSRSFADHNGLSVGDTVPLRLYEITLTEHVVSYYPSEEAGAVTQSIFVPSPFNLEKEVTDPIPYTIVGIMNIMPTDVTDYAISRSMVIIPDRSFDGVFGGADASESEAMFIPLLHDAVIVPNGQIDETRELINSIADGYGYFFRFYDQGYNSIKIALSNLRFGLSWILGLAAAVWFAVVFLYSFFYTARKRKEASILNAIGVNQKSRFRWVFVQGTLPILISLCFSLAISLPLYEYIIDAAANATKAFTDAFRNLTLSNAADLGIRRSVPLSTSPIAMVITALFGTLLLLAVTWFMSVRAARFSSLSAGKGED
ncbi:MAG: ABC transporter permease [Oscillospiraceae bacterium]|nr:ABC transporter permease [Oscillospiraceae bacterium]